MKRLIAFIIVAIIITMLFPLSAVCADSIVFGTVSLPEGEIAPSGGIWVLVYLQLPVGLGIDNITPVFISKGCNSKSFVIRTQLDISSGAYIIGYDLDTYNTVYISQGYYSNCGTVFNSGEATPINSSNISQSFDITLSKGTLISGIVSLPDSYTAPYEGLEVNIGLESGLKSYTTSAIIPYNSKSVNYIISVPPVSQELKLYYFIYNNNTSYSYCGYYNENGTVLNSFEATPINISLGNQKFDIELIKGTVISGTVSLPGEEAAPSGGLEISIELISVAGSSPFPNKIVNIPGGGSSVDYTLTVPISNNSQLYKINYYICTRNTTYVETGYYCDKGTVLDKNSASTIDISLGDYENIDIVVLKGTVISGTVSLPRGESALNGEIYIGVFLESYDGEIYERYGTEITIPSGGNNANYKIAVPPSTESKTYLLYYYLYDEPFHITWGYYGANETVFSKENAILIDAKDGDRTALDMSLELSGYTYGITSLGVGTGKIIVNISSYKNIYDNPPILIISAYDKNNKLLKVIKKNTIPYVNQYYLDFPLPQDMMKLKAILWNDENNIKPVSEPAGITRGIGGAPLLPLPIN